MSALTDTTFHAKANGSPCHKDCPERTATCRQSCERFKRYDEERLRRSAERDMYAGGSNLTDGQRKRHVRNVKYKKLHTQGRM